jgi:probable DNA repair protein
LTPRPGSQQATVFSALDEGALLVTASVRQARLFHYEYAGRQQSLGLLAWKTPEILPWNQWLGFLLRQSPDEKVLLSGRQELLLWESVIRESDGGSVLLDIAATAESAAEAWRLSQEWILPAEDPAWNDQVDTRVFQGWVREYASRCRAKGWIDSALLPRELIRHLIAKRVPAPRQVLLAGFDEFTPRQIEFFDALRELGCKVTATASGLEQQGVVRRLDCPNQAAEIVQAASWARRLLECNSALHIGIVARDLAPVARQIEHALLEFLHPDSPQAACYGGQRAFHVALGRRLAEYPVIETAFAALELGGRVAPLTTYSHLLRSPFLAGFAGESGRRAVSDVQLRRLGLLEIALETVTAEARRRNCEILATHLNAAAEGSPGDDRRQTPSEWARNFAAHLRAVGWPGDRPLDSAEHQTLGAWRDALSMLASLDLVSGVVTRGEALSWLRRIAAGEIFQPEAGPAPVEVLGALDAAGARFDHLWVLGMHAGDWPAESRPHPFLPLRLQRKLDLPRSSPERELKAASRLFARLAGSAAAVTLSVPLQEEDRQLQPSPLLRGIPEFSPAWSAPATAAAVQRAAAAEECFSDERLPPLPVGSAQRGGSEVLKLQAMCPFRAAATLRFGARPLEQPGPGLDAARRGSLVHDTLRFFWRDAGSHAGLAGDQRDRIARAARQALDRIDRRLPLPHRFRTLEQQRLENLLAAWIETELGRQPFTMSKDEFEAEAEMGGLRMKLRVDRIDRLNATGESVLIDYKTGEPTPSAWEGQRPDDPQLPLYACTIGEPVGAVVFAQVRPGACRFKGLAARGDMLPGVTAGSVPLDVAVAGWRNVLEHLAANFREGHAAVDPKNGSATCEDCTLSALCRIGELGAWQATDTEENDAGDS